jgi:hypothetical protein
MRILDVKADPEELVCCAIWAEVALTITRATVEEVPASKVHVRLHVGCTSLACRWRKRDYFDRGAVDLLTTDSGGKKPFNKVRIR